MPVITDFLSLNAAANTSDWQTSQLDAPQLNDSAANTPIYIENVSCMFLPFKKGLTNAYTYTSVIPASPSMVGRLAVAWVNYPFADIDAIPITTLDIRVSSSTGFTTNYYQWDGLAQILSPKNIPVSGHTPIMVYPSNPDSQNGNFIPGSIESIGFVISTGNNNDGKQGGFDMLFLVGYLGGQGETWTDTFFDALAAEATPSQIPGTAGRPLGVFTKSGAFYRSNVNIRLGNGSATATRVSESAKTIYFDNVETDHALGYEFIAGTGDVDFELLGCVNFWNGQDSTAEIFTDADNADKFIIDGSSFARGGKATLPAWISDILSSGVGVSFDACGEVTIGDFPLTGSTISNALSGALIDTAATKRHGGNTYSGCTDAVRIVGTGPNQSITLDDNFVGNTTDIFFDAPSGTLTVNVAEGVTDAPTTWRVPGGSTATVNIVAGQKSFTFTVNPSITGYEWRLYDADPTQGIIGTELAGEESATQDNQTYNYSYTVDNPVALQIIEPGYEEYLEYFTLGNNNQSITANLEVETNA